MLPNRRRLLRTLPLLAGLLAAPAVGARQANTLPHEARCVDRAPFIMTQSGGNFVIACKLPRHRNPDSPRSPIDPLVFGSSIKFDSTLFTKVARQGAGAGNAQHR